MRIYGYSSADTPHVLKLLRDDLPRLDQLPALKRNALLITCGNCLREPEDIAQFATCMLRTDVNQNWMRALSRMLAYREDAARDISTECCEEIAEHCFRRIKKQIDNKKEAFYTYRHGSVCIAYLLRRRRYDDSYMDPSKEFACRIKSFLKQTLEGMDNHTISVMGGLVDLPAITRLIIDYIDRKGKGVIKLE